MNQVATLLWAKGRIAVHTIKSVRTESKLKIAVITVAAILLWLGAYFIALRGFSFFIKYGAGIGGADMSNIGEIVMIRMLSVFSLALFFMLVSSNVLIAFSTMYRSREVVYLIQSPISFEHFFIARFVECVSFSSWASAFLGSPLVLAYGQATGSSPGFYLAALLYYLPFVTLPAAIGAIITIVLVLVVPRIPRFVLVPAALLGLAAFFVSLRARFNAARLSEDTVFQTVFSAMDQTQSPWLPSYWAAQGVLSAANGDVAACVFNLLLISANAIFATWVVMRLSGLLFYPGWSYLFGQDRTRFKPLDRGLLGRLDTILKPIPQPYRGLVVKDLKLFWRDATQWTQFVIFFGLMAIYIANLRNTPGSQVEYDMWRGWIASLNSAACMLILSTLTSRFVFPLISLEGRRFWILGLAPLTYKQLMHQKFWLSFVTTSLFTIGLTVLSCIRLQVDGVAFGMALYSIIATNFGLAGLAVGLGALFPNFQEENPARIVSGMGGTLNFLLSMGYITLIAAAQGIILQWRYFERFTDSEFFAALAVALVFIGVLSTVCTLLPLTLGYRNLKNSEF